MSITKHKLLYILLFINILIQLVLLFYIQKLQIDDSITYMKIATDAFLNQEWYPNEAAIYSDYIFAPGYINYLILVFKLFGVSDMVVRVFNILFILILFFQMYYIAHSLFNKRAAVITAILYTIYPIYHAITFHVRTDLFYSIVVFSVLCLVIKLCERPLQRRGYNYLLFSLAGILLAFGNWIRPFAIIMLGATLLIMFIKRVNIKYMATYVGAIILTVALIGIATYERIGYFNYQSTTSGVNLIMGASDSAYGGFNSKVFEEGHAGHIANIHEYTFLERDEYWRKQAITWIKENPLDYLLLFPKKLYYMYANDFGFIDTYIPEGQVVNEYFIDHLYEDVTPLKVVYIFTDLFYKTILIAMLLGMINLVRKRHPYLLVLLLIFLGQTGMTIIAVGGNIYHFPIFLLFIVVAAYGIDYVLQLRVSTNKVKEQEENSIL